ncbi:class I SAM-dependent methyltransferase [Schumannella luteola]
MSIALDFDALRRWPDAEAPNLVAVDATDRLLLDLAADAIGAAPEDVLVIDDNYGALTLGAIALGARQVRVHQDSIVAERALAANAERLGGEAEFRSVERDDFDGVRVVLWQLPRSLERLGDLARRIALAADPGVVVVAGGRIKHMSTGMNDVLREHFDRVDVTHARQKSRALVARGPHPGPAPVVEPLVVEGVRVEPAPGVFNGGRLDIGTRALLAVIDELPDARTAVDLGCGSGILAARLAQRYPGADVIATDVSAAAVRAAARTAELSGLPNVRVLRDDAGQSIPDSSVDLVLLNPPFHDGGAVHTGIASKLFASASRMLRPGGELWTVYNSALAYRPELQRVVGPTRQVSRTPKFTVTSSTRRP